MKPSGGTRPRSGWLQRSSASAPTMRRVRQVDLGLVVQLELAARAIARRRSASSARRLAGALRQRFRVELVACAAACLGLEQRGVGLAHQQRPAPTASGPRPRWRCRCWPTRRPAGRRSRRAATAPRRCAARCARASRARARRASAPANSSPPRRATVSRSRRQRAGAAPTATSSRSPAAWPSVSLTFLKRSRSRHIEHCRGLTGCSRSRAWKPARLVRPVSVSRKARSCRSRWVVFSSVMSCVVVIVKRAAPVRTVLEAVHDAQVAQAVGAVDAGVEVQLGLAALHGFAGQCLRPVWSLATTRATAVTGRRSSRCRCRTGAVHRRTASRCGRGGPTAHGPCGQPARRPRAG